MARSKQKKKIFFADFETTAVNENNVVSVYLWAMVNGTTVYTGYDIESFIDKLRTLKAVIYFHNLKFDFSYIHYYLLSNNISCQILEKKGTYYSVKFFDIELRDTMNFFPNMSVKDVGENYCTKYQKTSIDIVVEHGHIATAEEIEYCVNDCRVIEEGYNNYMSALFEVLQDAGCSYTAGRLQRKLTNAGIAFEAFKEMSDFDTLCPKTTLNEYNAFRGAYKGGYVYSCPRGIVNSVRMIDNNSMYPFTYSTMKLPYGYPIKCLEWSELEKYDFYIVNIEIKYELKPGYIPIIGGGVGKYGGTVYKSSSNGEYEDLTVCNIDLELIKEFYDCDISLRWGCGFNTKKKLFKKYCDTFIAVKNANKGAKRNVAKVLLNSPYGKTAMNGLNELKNYYIDSVENIVKSEVIGYEVDENIFQYLPIAIAITAGARHLLLTTAKSIGFEHVHYMDTDSIKYDSNIDVPFEFDPDTLGAWKDEGLVDLFKTISPKKYVYYMDGVIKFTCAGFNKKTLEAELYHNQQVPKDLAISLMNRFDSGLKLSCLQSVKVRGGRALIPITKRVN